jgi:aspartyl/asparaginyl beta-hydroxylase (cupin superfamily)
MNAIADRGKADDDRLKSVAPAHQVWATPGIAAMDRPGTFARLLLATVAFAERLNARQARLGNPPVYDNVQFPWVERLEREWRTIRSDLDRVLARKNDLPNIQDITPDARAITTDDGWKTFIFLAYGVKSPPNIALCPETWRVLRTIPGLKTAMFSIFEPGKRLPPHRGPYNGVLRLHLGLKVPLPRDSAMIRIATDLRAWEEGKALVFDDAYEHEAWNETDEPRVVLFVDFLKPLRFPANLVNRLILKLALFSPYIREGDQNLRRWERQFYG